SASRHALFSTSPTSVPTSPITPYQLPIPRCSDPPLPENLDADATNTTGAVPRLMAVYAVSVGGQHAPVVGAYQCSQGSAVAAATDLVHRSHRRHHHPQGVEA